ncbi:MAG TPA: PLP-dependent aminotransferase family protein [Candidatus Sulfotelmatobacter sp.]|nr:PLP-dependent aminotransferase family protein [Candidatus Sulfotelmatobacter sp.]
MPKRTTAFELVLPPRIRGIAAYRWLYDSLRSEILHGRLRPGARLPATRDLAGQYALSRGTIVNAFEQLKSEGYVEGNVGSGTYVSKVLPEELLRVRVGEGQRPSSPATPRRRFSGYGRRVRLFPGYENRPTRAFRSNLPALDLFPTSLWAQITARRARHISRNQLMRCDALGFLPLRQAVAQYLGTSRGVRCVAEQVAILSGVQEALDLAARLFLNPGEVVCLESPGYPGAALAFRAFGAKIRAAGVDDDGIRVRELPRRGVRLLYITPGHQFPLGATMTLPRRLQVLEWARQSGAVIFEDDYDSEFRYSGRPIPALQGLDRSGSVLYAGSFSKVLFPSLRLGYLVAPPDLLERLEAIKSLTSRHTPLLEQLVLSDFIVEGHFGRHLRRMRQVYAERLSVLLKEAKGELTGMLNISNVEAGLQTVGWLCPAISSESAAAAAAQRGVEVTPLNRYSYGKDAPEGLQLGFAAIDAKEIRRGIQGLALALAGLRSGSRIKS